MIKDPKFARFYLLPKIHKRSENVPRRPVISNCGFYTENISAFLDFPLQPLAREVKSYIKDTNNFLKKLRSLRNIPNDIILCSVDVAGLYPNILHDEGLSALQKRLELKREKKVSTSTLVELAEVVLKNNVFIFGKKTLKQLQGTAIGTKFDPPYSILFIAELEEEILRKVELKAYLWWRYIDDIFFIWKHGEEKLKTFIDVLNKKHPAIKFTAEWSKTQIKFLDVTVYLENGKIKTDFHVKPTDTHQYLHSSSCHPYHCKEGIPYSQTLRLNRICSDSTSFDRRCNDLERWLLERGYKEKEVRKQILRGRAFCRDDILNRERTLQEKTQVTYNLIYILFLKMSGKSLKSYTLYLHQTKLIRRLFQKYLLLVLKTPRVLRIT